MKYIHQIIGIIIFVIIMCSCSHKIVLGPAQGPLKVQYFNNNDTIINRGETAVVIKTYKLNRYIAYIDKGYINPSMKTFKRHFYRYCKKL